MSDKSSIDRFDDKARAYSAARPSYAQAALNFLYSTYLDGNSVIADVGSGTGILTAQFLERGNTVYGVEPNDGMRAKAESMLNAYANFCSVSGRAEDTTLAEGSVDIVTAAQAFHWFDADKFKIECRRILKPQGRVVLFWNAPDKDAPVNQRREEVLRRFCPDFRGFLGGISENDERIEKFFDGRFERKDFENPLFYDREKFILRCLSSSYALKEGAENYSEFLRDLSSLFDEFARGGVLTLPNKTSLYMGEIR